MRVALVHEFLTQFGGAERVLQNFLEIWPDAEVHVLVYSPKKIGHAFDHAKIKTSFVGSLPMAKSDHKWYLSMMPSGIESFKFNDFDVVLSDASSFAKGVKTKKLHICYCHTPTRFLWTESEDYLKSQPYLGVVKLAVRPILKWLRRWDYKAAQRPSFFIANSKNVQERIKKYYTRDSTVIYPPVDTEFFQPTGSKKDYFLVASRLEPYKKIELVVQAFNELGWPLKVAGSGTNAEKLRKIAKPNIEFVGKTTDEQLRTLYSEAKAYIFPAEEDAGIMMLEAQSCGTPVIAYKAGGALELIQENVSGKFFTLQSVDAITKAVKEFNPNAFPAAEVRANALRFDKKNFQKQIKDFVEAKYSGTKIA